MVLDTWGGTSRLGSQSRRLLLCSGLKWLGSGQNLIRRKGHFQEIVADEPAGQYNIGWWGIRIRIGIVERFWSNFFSKFLHLLGSLYLKNPRNRELCTYENMSLYLWTMYDYYLSWRLPPGNFPHQQDSPLTSFTKRVWCILPLFSVQNSPLLFIILCGTWFVDVLFVSISHGE